MIASTLNFFSDDSDTSIRIIKQGTASDSITLSIIIYDKK